jgi:type IV pilus assembly protein PilM
MAKTAKIAWGIDLGNCALKALKLGIGPEKVEVLDFAVIEHEKILSQPDLDNQQRIDLIDKALDLFLSEHDISNSCVVVSVPGQNSFARFIKLPPVEKKRIPEIVRYEAIQQIPFEIADVEWDWQAFFQADGPEVEVGIFAIKRDLVKKALRPFAQANCLINIVQMAPMALYNFLRYDQKHIQEALDKEAIVTLDIGADNTNLVIADGPRVWQRNIPIGGNQFTAAVQKTFKLSFSKAEVIKRTASTSKYARQIFQAMRPVFADLAAEVQRSLGFYSSSNRQVQFREVLALGNAMKLPGLVKFLQQSLSLPVKRLDNFESLTLSSDISPAEFTKKLPTLGVAYGLALQGLGYGIITSNLLPREIIRQTQWQRKRSWFIAASACFVGAGLLFFLSAFTQQRNIHSTTDDVNAITGCVSTVKNNTATQSKYLGDIKKASDTIEQRMALYKPRGMVPTLLQTVLDCLPNEVNNPDPQQQKIYQAFNAGNRQAVMDMPRQLRKQVFITGLNVVYTEDLTQDFNQILKETQTTTVRRSSGGGEMSGGRPGGMPGPRGGMPGPRGGMPGPRGDMPGPRGDMPMDMEQRSSAPASDRSLETIGSTKGGGKSVPGFVIVLEGHTPHKEGLDFLWPPEVGLDRQKWGFFNQLYHLGKTDEQIIAEKDKTPKESSGVTATGMKTNLGTGFKPGGIKKNATTTPEKTPEDASVPAAGSEKLPDNDYQKQASARAGQTSFMCYIGSEELKHDFDSSQSDWITTGATTDQPNGLGIFKTETITSPASVTGLRGDSSSDKKKLQDILIDPFTFEPISETYKYDADGNVVCDNSGQPDVQHHDYWFRIKFKVQLKNSPPDKN